MDYEVYRKQIIIPEDITRLDEVNYLDEIHRKKAIEMYKNGENLNNIIKFSLHQKRKEVAEWLKKEANLNKRFKSRTFDNFIIENDIQKSAFQKCVDYSKNIETYLERGTGLFIAGNGCVGTGKTHIACAVANDLLDNGYPVKVINVAKMIYQIKEDFNVKPYLDALILFIDDLGKETGTQWVCEMLYFIFNERYEKMKPIIITTENGLDEIRENYKIIVNGREIDRGKSIVSRLVEDFIYISLTGEDFRKRRKA